MTATQTQIAAIRKGRGILKGKGNRRRPIGKPNFGFAKEWAAHKRDELELEGSKLNPPTSQSY